MFNDQIRSDAILKSVITAWEMLNQGEHTPMVIENWLVNTMKPAIDKAREAVERSDNNNEIQRIEEFYNFLQGEIPEEIHLFRGHKPKLSPKKAFSIIWYLQEHFPLLPDHIERCDNCGNLFDTDCGGIYWESKGKHFCDACEYLVPDNYDKGKK